MRAQSLRNSKGVEATSSCGDPCESLQIWTPFFLENQVFTFNFPSSYSPVYTPALHISLSFSIEAWVWHYYYIRRVMTRITNDRRRIYDCIPCSKLPTRRRRDIRTLLWIFLCLLGLSLWGSRNYLLLGTLPQRHLSSRDSMMPNGNTSSSFFFLS